MAIREYIGARYVLKIYENSQNPLSADWESGVNYEPLVMVNYNNSSYISKKQVPATIGNPVDNPSYWALSGLYNGQIAQIQNDVNSLKDDVDELQDFVGRRYIFVGDSYGAGQGPDGDTTSYISVCAGKLGLTLGVDYFTASIGGASWKGLNGRPSFRSVLETIENAVTNPDTITDIVVCGGVNDAVGTIGDGLGGMTDFDTYARTKYPNARVHVGLIGWSKNDSTRTNILEVSNPIYTSCGFRGFGLLDMKYPILHDYSGDFQSDGTHPSQNGQNKIGWQLSAALLGDKGRYANPIKFVISTDTSYFTSPLSLTAYDMIDDTYSFILESGTKNVQSSTFSGWDTPIDFGVLTNASNFNCLNNSAIGQCFVLIGWNDGTTHLTPATCVLNVYNGHLYGRLVGEHTISPTGVVFLKFATTQFTINRWLI